MKIITTRFTNGFKWHCIVKHFTKVNIISALIALIIVGLFKYSGLAHWLLDVLGIYTSELNEYIV